MALTLQALVDHVRIQRPIEVHQDTGGQPTGHQHDVDAVTNASVTVLGGDRLVKSRVEGTLGVLIDRPDGLAPTRWRPSVRVSLEEDYRSYSGRLAAATELLRRNVTLEGFVGFGLDQVLPTRHPPGEEHLWPATHQRVNAGLSLGQILSRRLVLFAGVAANHQFGRLSSPYRRALVRTTLFPERLPEARTRVTGFLSVSWYLGWETALHLRTGAYADTWEVLAFIPQAAVTKEIARDVVATLHLRYYRQTDAHFYEPRYEELAELRTGDARLGRVEEYQPGLEVLWNFKSMFVTAGYRISALHYPDLGRRVWAHIGLLAVGGAK